MTDFFNTEDRANNPTFLARSTASSAILTGISEVIAATINVPANFLGPSDMLMFQGLVSGVPVTNNSVFRLRYNNLAGLLLSSISYAATQLNLSFLFFLNANYATNAQISPPFVTPGTASNAIIPSSIDMTLPQTFVLTIANNNAASTIQLMTYAVYKW